MQATVDTFMAQVLVVANTRRGVAVRHILEEAGHEAMLVRTLATAIERLRFRSPDLLVSELRLGACNGLYLVIRHQETHPFMRAIVIDAMFDSVLAADAARYRACYLSEPLDKVTLLEHVSRSLEAGPQRRWPRWSSGGLVAEVQNEAARVVDLGYGGLCLEFPKELDVPRRFRIVLSDSGLAIQARAVWTRGGPSGSMWCGAAHSGKDPSTKLEWRQLVNSASTASHADATVRGLNSPSAEGAGWHRPLRHWPQVLLPA